MKKFLSLFAVFFILISCDHRIDLKKEFDGKIVNLTQEEFLSIAYEQPTELNVEEVKLIASDFLNSFEKKVSVTATRSNEVNFKIGTVSKSNFTPYATQQTRSFSADTLTLPIYEVNIISGKGQGVIYVSADKCNAEVITFIPQVSQDKEVFVKSGGAFFLEWAKKSAYEQFIRTKNTKEKLRDITISKISSQLGINKSDVKWEQISDKVIVEKTTRATPINSPTTQIVSICAPIVKTEWSQTSPYNLLLPPPNAPSFQKHVYTGCAVTAACQLMTAIKPNLTLDGMSIDWNYLTETPQIDMTVPQRKLEMVGKLHKWVFEQLDATPAYDANGYHNGTGVSANNQVWFYGNYFNHSENYEKYNPDALLRSFRLGRPALIRGQGHAWIVDEYIIAQKTITNKADTRAVIVQYYDMFWHVNLGWGGSSNGYYKLNPNTHVTFETRDYTFTTDGLFTYPGLYKKENNNLLAELN